MRLTWSAYPTPPMARRADRTHDHRTHEHEGNPKGKLAYRPCAPCHGPQGEGIHAVNSPAIAGLDAAYIERQLDNFRNGKRGTDPRDPHGIAMAPMAEVLETDEVRPRGYRGSRGRRR